MRAGWIVTAGLEACLALIAGAARADAAPQGRPNILLILSDDHRWDSLGIAGNRGVRTPALDGLARTGLWFRQATIHVPQCSPSRSTLLTGLAPHQHRWYGNQYQHPWKADEPRWRIYDEAVCALDEQVGRVLRALDDRKLAENTIVAFVGDNGFMMGDRGMGGKVVPYEGSVRVPMMVRAPGIATIKGTSESPVSSLDIPPTLLRCAGLEPPRGWPGRDLTKLLRGAADPGIDAAVCQWFDDQSEMFGALAYRLVRTPRYKLVLFKDPKRPDELYDLETDPHELHNLITDQALASVRNQLRDRLQAWLERTDDPARLWPRDKPAVNP